MDEKQLQELYNSMISKDPSYKDYMPFESFKQKMLDKSYYDKVTSFVGAKKEKTDASKITGTLTQPEPVQRQQMPEQRKPIEAPIPTAISKAEKMEVAEPDIDPGKFISNTISSLDRGFYKNLIGNPVKGIGTLLGSATTKLTGGTEKGFVSNALVKFGDYFNNAIDELAPMDEEFKGSLMDQFSQAFGQVASLALTYGAGSAGSGATELAKTASASASKLSPRMLAAKTLASESASPAAVSAGLSMGQAEFDRAKEAGASDDEAFEAFYKNAIVGSILEKIPIMQFMKRFNKASSGGMVEYIKNKALSGVTGGVEEMTTEVLQQIYANKTAQDIYNINQNIFEGVGESGGVGFGVGFLLNAMGASSKILKDQGKSEESAVIENQIIEFEKQAQNGGVSSYRVNGINISDPSIIDEMIDNMSATDLSKSNIKIVNDPNRNARLRDKIITSSIKEQVRESNPKLSDSQVDEITNLEKELKKFEGSTIQSGKDKVSEIRSQIKQIQENAVQEQATNEGVLRQEGSQVGLQEVVQGDQGAGIEGAQQGQEQAAAAPATITGLSISDPEVDTRVTDEKQKGVLSFARKAVSAISSIMPGVEFIVHDNSDSYTEAVSQRLGKESKDVAGTSGYFTYGADGSVRIDIDLTNANSRTVAHEVAHAVLYKKFNEDFALFKDFKNRLSGVVSSMAPQDFVTEAGEVTTVKDQLADFVSRYEGQGEDVKAEEFITELSAMLTSNEAKISTSGWNKISTFIGDFVSKITGGKINLFEGAKTTRDVVDFFNSMSKAIATGEDISGINFARPNMQAKPRTTPAPGFNGKASMLGDLVLKRNFSNEDIKQGATIKDIGDGDVHLTFSDRLSTGKMGDKEMLGGILHAAATGNFWASSKPTSASRIINASKKAKRDSDGYFTMMPALMTTESQMSSRDLIEIVLAEAKAVVNSKEVKESDMLSRIRRAMSRAGLESDFNKEISKSKKKESIDNIISATEKVIYGEKSTFESRRNFNESLLGNADLKESARLGSLPTFTQLASTIAEPLSLGHEKGDVILAIKTKGELKSVKVNPGEKGYHPSYEYVIKSFEPDGVTEAKVETVVFKNAYNAIDLFPSFKKTDGADVTFDGYKEKYGDTKQARDRYLNMMGMAQLSSSVTEKPKAEAAEKKPVAEVFSDSIKKQDENKYKPLPGAPIKSKEIAGPDPNLVSVAEQYAKENGIELKRQGEYVEINEDLSKRIAQAFEDMKHDPSNKKVKEAYADLIKQTRAQYEALVKAGYEFTFFDSKTDPYKGNPSDAMRDLRGNKKMAVYGTYDGYGTEGITATEQAENPLLEDTGLKWKDQNGVEQQVTGNDLFRAVHDAFGHGLEGAGFRARGEENAWQAHVRLFQGPAVGAITTETRGQNSWLNFGPYGEKNRTAKIEDTVFGEQKIGLMPEWTWTEGRSPDYEAQKEKKPEVKGKASVLSNYRDNKRFKFSDLKYPDTVLGNIKEGKDVNTAINFYEKIVRVFNKTFDRDVKVYSEKSKNNFGVTVEYETGLKPKYFSYPTSKMGEHVVVDKIDKFTPLTSLRHELIHEMLVKNITDKFERINEMDQSAVSESIENVQRNRAYNYSLEDVFFERVVENIERLPDNKDTFPIETYAQDVVNRLVSELNNESPSKEDVNAKLDELLEGSTPWLSKNLKEAVNAADFGKPLKESVDKIGKYFLDRFTVSKDIFPKELQEKIFKFTEVFNDEYQGVLTRLKSTEKAKPEVKGKASRMAPLITDKKILSQMTEDNDGNFLFYHVSPSRISGKIDPKFFGRNLRTGRDERPGIGISMYYTRPDRADVSGEYKYVAAIPKDKVYPFNSDPLDLYDKARASFEKMYPGQAFDPNKQVAFISREAEKLGYQMTVAKWGDGLRAQTTKAIRPEWLERPNGNKVEVNEKFKDFKANSKTAVKGKASMMAANTEESNRSIKQEFVDEVNKASIDKFGEPYFPSIDNPNVVVLTSSEVDKLENEKCKSNKCETNTYKLVKENPDKYYPVRGYFVNKNNYPVEHWWLYDRQSKKYLEITPDENENVPKDYIKGYIGVVNKNINEEIVNSNKVFDVDFFQSNQRQEFKKIISEENAAAAKPEVKGKASMMAPENVVSESTLPGYDSLVAGIAKYVSNAISRGDAKADIVRTAVDIAQSSPIYESANDVQREQIVREARKAAGASQKSSPSVSRLFGIKPKDVTMTELQALNKQISDLARGARESKNDINERRRNLSDAVRKLAASGNVSAKKVAAIINKISNLNLYNTKKVNEFIQYATNVFADADYAEKLSIANATRKQIKKLSKSADKFANLRDLGSRFSEIDPSLVSDIDEYNNIASLVKESIKGSTVRGTDPVFAIIANEEQVNEYISDTIDSQDQQLLDAKIEEAQDLLGFDATGMTYDEILELLEPNKTIAKDVENIIRAGINKAFDIYKTIINDILSTGVDSFTGDPVNYSDNQKRVISEFININPGDLKIKNALEAVDALVNFITNGSIAKMESVVERYNGEQNMIRANRNGVRASSLRKYGSKLLGQSLVEQTAFLSILLERMFGGFNRGGFMEDMMGIADIKNGASKAKTESNDVVKKYVEIFYDKKANGQDFNTAYNNIERGMIAFLVKGISGTQKEIKAEFNRRKNLILGVDSDGNRTGSIPQLEKGNDQEKEKAKIYQQVFDKIAQNSSTAQDVINAADRTNLDSVEFWVDNWIDRYQTLSDVALGIYNKVLGRDVNYTPDRFSKLSYGTSEVDMSSEDMSFIFNSGNASFYKKETGVLMKATKPDTLPSERYVDLSFDNNNANSLYDALVDVNTAGAIRRSESAMNSSAFQNIIESVDDRKLLVRRVRLYVNNVRRKSPFSDDTLATVSKRLNRLATIGVGQALGGILQPIKQAVPIAINTLINAGGLNVSSISNRSIQDFINKSGYAIANRGIESQAQIETLDKMIEQAATSRGGKAIEKIEAANKWWLKNFLVKFDVAIARASWITYYEQYLKKEGLYETVIVNQTTASGTLTVSVPGIDYSSHKLNKEAAYYAERQVNRQQSGSDSDSAGAILSSKEPAKQLFTKILMPFASFRMNQSARLGSDISTLLNKTATKEDKKIAARSAAGFVAEMATFRAISYGSALVIAEVAAGMMGKDDDDEEEKKKREAILKGQLTSTVADMFSPAPIVDKLVQGGVSKALESTQDMLDVEKEDRVGIYSGDKQTFFQSLGLLGITGERAAQLWEMASLSTSGKFTDNFGNKKQISDKDKSALSMLIPISILSTIGLAPSEANSVVRSSVRLAKKDAEKADEDGESVAPKKPETIKERRSRIKKDREDRMKQRKEQFRQRRSR